MDLNRNLPTKNWTNQPSGPEESNHPTKIKDLEKNRYNPGPNPCSETENKTLVEWIENSKPKLIITLHSWKPMIITTGNCLPEAKIISEMIGYKLTDDIGYPTPGSLGDYCGLERNIPVITYEAARGGTIKEALSVHVPAIEKALFESEERQ